MGLFRSGPGLPAAVRSSVRAKALAATRSDDGAWLVGTRDALFVVEDDGSVRLSPRWEQVQRADWDAETSTLRVEEIQDYGRPVAACSFVLTDPGMLLTLVRERVTASVVLQRRIELRRRRGFSVIGRRAPSGGGPISWAYEFDEGVDPDDPAVMTAADAALQEAQEALGLL